MLTPAISISCYMYHSYTGSLQAHPPRILQPGTFRLPAKPGYAREDKVNGGMKSTLLSSQVLHRLHLQPTSRKPNTILATCKKEGREIITVSKTIKRNTEKVHQCQSSLRHQVPNGLRVQISTLPKRFKACITHPTVLPATQVHIANYINSGTRR